LSVNREKTVGAASCREKPAGLLRIQHVTTHVVGLKGQKSKIAALWRKYLMLASNMAFECAFSKQSSALSPAT